MTKNFQIYTDGGARGNPGPSAIGVVIKTETGQVIESISQTIGIGTNNEAEYKALIKALEFILNNKQKFTLNDKDLINFFSDSSLLVNQVNGLFKVKNGRMREFIYRIREIESQIPCKIIYNLIPREKNSQADTLVNQALDKEMYL